MTFKGLQANDLNRPITLNAIKGLRLLWVFLNHTNWLSYKILMLSFWNAIQEIANIVLVCLSYILIASVFGRIMFGG